MTACIVFNCVLPVFNKEYDDDDDDDDDVIVYYYCTSRPTCVSSTVYSLYFCYSSAAASFANKDVHYYSRQKMHDCKIADQIANFYLLLIA